MNVIHGCRKAGALTTDLNWIHMAKIAVEGGLVPKALTRCQIYFLDQTDKTEEYHLNIEKLTALIRL